MEQELNLNYFYNLAYLERKPVSAVIELLTECNLRCKHCYIPSHTNKGMSTEKIKSLLYELHAMGVLNISFTGGEIFLHPHIMDFIALARSLHMRVFLLSNGTLLNESIVKSLSELHISEFSTTMFSLDPKVHDFITSQPGSLDILLKNLQLLKKYNINVKIKTPLLDVNAFEYRDIKKYCEKRKDAYWLTRNKLEQSEIGKEVLDVLDKRYGEFTDCIYTTAHLELIIKEFCSDDKIKSHYLKIIRKTETELRNPIAHTIVAVDNGMIKNRIGITAEELYNDVIKKVAESVRLMKKSTWNSYDEMNKLLIEKVREVK